MAQEENPHQFDIILYGATSFVGQIISRYFAENHPPGKGELTWALAGRSRSKLASLAGSLGLESPVEILTADASRPEELRKLCKRARVILTTVGPYALYGENLVKACSETGTDYCDLTGEVTWVYEMIQKYDAAARKSGARVINCSGFDSIPSDLGTHYTQALFQKKYGRPASRIKLRIKTARGGVSGGTVASMLELIKQATGDSELRSRLADPYLLAGRKIPGVKQPEVILPVWEKEFNSWATYFVMGAINTRVVHRTNALTDYAYGQDFKYDEGMLTGTGPLGWAKAQGIVTGLGAFAGLAAFTPSRALLEKTLLPEPGEGPSEEDQKNGFFDIRLWAGGEDEQKLSARVYGDADPGYGSTAKMVSEVAILLAETKSGDSEGGFLTPAAAFGDQLVERLKERAGLKFQAQ